MKIIKENARAGSNQASAKNRTLHGDYITTNKISVFDKELNRVLCEVGCVVTRVYPILNYTGGNHG